MADINVADLPVTSSSDFTNNDYFLIVNDGSANILAKPTLLSWIRENVEGKKGDQGVQGVAGNDGVNGTNGISATHQWNGTVLTITSASGTSSADLKGASGNNGTNGINGTNGWSPVLSIVNDDERRVLRVSGWVGGSGTPPATGQYISSTGLTNTISNAVDIRGGRGLTGNKGDDGDKGDKGNDGLGVSGLAYNLDGSLTATMTDSSTITSNTPPRILGWGKYTDTVYTSINPFAITADTETIIPNNAGTTVVDQLPTSVTSFYNQTSQKILIPSLGAYTINVDLKCVINATPSTPAYLTIIYDDGLTVKAYTEDFLHRLDNSPQTYSFQHTITAVGGTITNGVSIKLKTSMNAQVYDIGYSIIKVV